MKIEFATVTIYRDEAAIERETNFPEGEVTLAELKRHALTIAESAASGERLFSRLKMLRRPSVEDLSADELTVDFHFSFSKCTWASITVSYCLEGYAERNGLKAAGEEE